MRKNYIIKDARRILAEQIRDNGMNTMNKNPITNATGLSAIIPKDNDGYCTVYKMDCEDGLGLMTVYQVYPGIQLIYNDFEATSCYWDGTIDKNVLEINHCREGREGSVLQSGSCLYLGEGDLSIHTMDNCASEMAFPLRHYRGISVVLDLELVSQNPPGILAESGIGIADFKNKFCADGSCFVMRAKDEIEHMLKSLNATNQLKSFKANLFSLTWAQRMPSDTEIKDTLKTLKIYSLSSSRTKTILDKLENNRRKEYVPTSEYTIEHIMPQTLSDDWKSDLGADANRIHETYVHTIGNLTLTGYNSEYQNKRFSDKVDCTDKAGNAIGYRHTPIKISSYLTTVSKWGEDEILARAEMLSDELITIWKYPKKD